MMKASGALAASLVLSCCATAVNAAIEKDLIKQLPGWAKPLPSRQYSGYLQVPGDHGPKMYHYWFVESESSPSSDPVALWWATSACILLSVSCGCRYYFDINIVDCRAVAVCF